MGEVMSNVVYLSNRRACVAPDARADGGRRQIFFDQHCIKIDRAVAGVKMRLAVPVETYRGVILTCEETVGQHLYCVTLVHRDPEFSVVLHHSEDWMDVLSIWQAWARYFGRPAIYDEAEMGEEELRAEVLLRPRRRGAALSKRRPRILKRRRQGRLGDMVNVLAAAQDLI
jgi:Family of unknown function (DUF6101)